MFKSYSKTIASLLGIFLFAWFVLQGQQVSAQAKAKKPAGKPISTDLFGVFFEDISYAADGGLYAELIQNRSFEYTPGDMDAWSSKRNNWNSFAGWQYTNRGYGYGSISLETKEPLHPNNPHYVVIKVEEAGKEGVGLTNTGFDGIAVKAGADYHFSVFVKQLSAKAIPFTVKILGSHGDTLAIADFATHSGNWEKYSLVLKASRTDDSCSVAVLAGATGNFAIDMVSLFPAATFKNRPNGLRADIASAIAELKPKFMRFPGGCLVHGDGLGNMYRWKNTIGPPEERIDQKNIWNYHQSVGLGYYEYFQFCEDIGAAPLPVVAAGVSCQNSGGTWRTGSNGQKAIPLNEMQAWIQDVLDLIEWVNGPATSTWGAKRSAAGHPQPFGLKYLGIGNEDKMTPEFEERFTMVYNAVKAKHPEITLVGTVGPGPSGTDYTLGWQLANQLQVPVVDEHYYEKPDWFLLNNARYDGYNRSKSKVYVGEYASWGNSLLNALSEAAYMTSLERNGDIVQMASYAPLLANSNHISWSPDLIYFTNTSLTRSINYYVQQLFSANQGAVYFGNRVSFKTNNAGSDSTLAASCTKDLVSGDIILKIVNAGAKEMLAQADLSGLGIHAGKAATSILTGKPEQVNTNTSSLPLIPSLSAIPVTANFSYTAPAYSLSVIRVKTGK
jgi:alpha-L-arabinofuranosidase